MEQRVAASSEGGRPFRFSIDRGGTFTDVYAEVPGSKGFRVLKLLSEDPHNYPDAPREGVRRILEVRGDCTQRCFSKTWYAVMPFAGWVVRVYIVSSASPQLLRL